MCCVGCRQCWNAKRNIKGLCNDDNSKPTFCILLVCLICYLSALFVCLICLLVCLSVYMFAPQLSLPYLIIFHNFNKERESFMMIQDYGFFMFSLFSFRYTHNVSVKFTRKRFETSLTCQNKGVLWGILKRLVRKIATRITII